MFVKQNHWVILFSTPSGRSGGGDMGINTAQQGKSSEGPTPEICSSLCFKQAMDSQRQ